jgi:hypothetical protein
MEDITLNDSPLNELEEQLFAMWNGGITKEEFLRHFLMSDMFIMVDGEPTGNTLGDKRPMVVATAMDQPRMMAVFSHPDRAIRMTQQFPDYNYPIMVDCRWVLHTVGMNLGVAVNPGWAIGFEIAPEGAQQLRQALEDAMARVDPD